MSEKPPTLPELLTLGTGFYIAFQFQSAFVGVCAMWVYLILALPSRGRLGGREP